MTPILIYSYQLDLQSPNPLGAAASSASDAEETGGDSESDGLEPVLNGSASVACDASGSAHAVALWVEYTLIEGEEDEDKAKGKAGPTSQPSSASEGGGGGRGGRAGKGDGTRGPSPHRPAVRYAAGGPAPQEESRPQRFVPLGWRQGVALARDESDGGSSIHVSGAEGSAPRQLTVEGGQTLCTISAVYNASSHCLNVGFGLSSN